MADSLDDILHQLGPLIKDERAKVELAVITGEVALVGAPDGLLRLAQTLIDTVKRARERDALPRDEKIGEAVMWSDCSHCFVTDNPALFVPELIDTIGVTENQEAVSRIVIALKKSDGQIDDIEEE